MTNVLKGEFEISVNPAEEGEAGETLTLVYDWDALCHLEEALDMGLIEILILMNRGFRLKLVAPLFWAGLRAHHPAVTLEAAKAMIPRCGGAFDLYRKMGEGIERAFPTPSAAEAAPADPPKRRAKARTAGSPRAASGSGSSTA